MLGPELYWLVVYLACRLLAARISPGDPTHIKMLERTSWAVPLVTVPLAFAIFYWLMPMSGARGWLTFRMMVSALIGLNAALIATTGAIDYGDSRNSGTYAFWFLGAALGGLLWIIAYVVVIWT